MATLVLDPPPGTMSLRLAGPAPRCRGASGTTLRPSDSTRAGDGPQWLSLGGVTSGSASAPSAAGFCAWPRKCSSLPPTLGGGASTLTSRVSLLPGRLRRHFDRSASGVPLFGSIAFGHSHFAEARPLCAVNGGVDDLRGRGEVLRQL